VRTILILAVNPNGTARLRLDEEVKKIEHALERSSGRARFKVVVKWAVTNDDLRRSLLDNKPEVVHFAGHGTGDGQRSTGRDLIPAGEVDENGLAFEDDAGNVHFISCDALARLLQLFSDTVKCVVLNACYSEFLANAITQHIDFVVGMKKAIGDPAAIKFAVGFYDALFSGLHFEPAFELGRSAIDLNGIPEQLTPILKKNSGAGTANRSSPPEEHVRKGIRERIERRLKLLRPDVLKYLAEELRRKNDPASEEERDPIPFVLTTLSERQRFSTIAGLTAIHERLCADADWGQAEIVAEIVEEVTPLVIDDGLAQQISMEMNVRKSAFFAVPDRHSTTLEIMMARADGKRMKFKPPGNDGAVDDYEGEPLLRRDRKMPVGAPVNAESVVKSILIDLCDSQDVRDSYAQSATIDELIQRLAGVLIVNSRGVNKDRTLYCLHKMPTHPDEQPVHEKALELIRDELNKLKRAKPEQWEDLPEFVFLLLAEKSEWEGLRSIIVTMLKRRFKHARPRTAHGTND